MPLAAHLTLALSASGEFGVRASVGIDRAGVERVANIRLGDGKLIFSQRRFHFSGCFVIK
jgi:hypothetical protein